MEGHAAQGDSQKERTPPPCPWSPVLLWQSSLGSGGQENQAALLSLVGQRAGSGVATDGDILNFPNFFPNPIVPIPWCPAPPPSASDLHGFLTGLLSHLPNCPPPSTLRLSNPPSRGPETQNPDIHTQSCHWPSRRPPGPCCLQDSPSPCSASRPPPASNSHLPSILSSCADTTLGNFPPLCLCTSTFSG